MLLGSQSPKFQSVILYDHLYDLKVTLNTKLSTKYVSNKCQ